MLKNAPQLYFINQATTVCKSTDYNQIIEPFPRFPRLKGGKRGRKSRENCFEFCRRFINFAADCKIEKHSLPNSN